MKFCLGEKLLSWDWVHRPSAAWRKDLPRGFFRVQCGLRFDVAKTPWKCPDSAATSAWHSCCSTKPGEWKLCVDQSAVTPPKNSVAAVTRHYGHPDEPADRRRRQPWNFCPVQAESERQSRRPATSFRERRIGHFAAQHQSTGLDVPTHFRRGSSRGSH